MENSNEINVNYLEDFQRRYDEGRFGTKFGDLVFNHNGNLLGIVLSVWFEHGIYPRTLIFYQHGIEVVFSYLPLAVPCV